jgi:hypothetical protein
METLSFNGWDRCVRLSNREIELVVTTAVGPRIARLGFKGKRNLFAEIAGQQGGRGEAEWMIRGGHRFWIAPEVKPLTYELDNTPITVEEIDGGVRTVQPAGPLSGCVKTMEIILAEHRNRVEVRHMLTNEGKSSIRLAPWAISVMAPDGMAVIPRPAFVAHTDRVLHNQEWSLWGYTDLTDSRWTLGQRYFFFRQDRTKGPNKLGIAQREGWVGYLLGEFLFVNRFSFDESATYPDGGVNFETFSNQDFLEIETLGRLTDLAPGASVSHTETWDLHSGVAHVTTEDDADRLVKPLVLS